MRSVFGLSRRRLSHSLLGGDTVVNRQPRGPTVTLRVAKKTRQRFVSRVTRLYEQGSIIEVIEGYVRRWRRWVTSGLGVWATRRWVFDYAFSERSRTGLEIERRLRRRRKRVKREKGYFLARLLR